MVTIYTIVGLFAIFVQAFFTATEMAFTSVDKVKLHGLARSGNKHAIKLEDLLSGKDMFLGTTLVGTNIAVIISTAMSTRIFMEYFGVAYSSAASILVMVPMTLVFAEIIPKMVARQYALQMGLYLVNPLKAFSNVFYPFISFINFTAQKILRPFLKNAGEHEMHFTKKELKKILRSGEDSGSFEEGEIDLIHKVLDFGVMVVQENMIPLYRVRAISYEEDIDTLKRLVSVTGFSRVPVYKGSKKNIIGIVYIYDVLFDNAAADGTQKITKYIRDATTVRSSDGLDIAFTRLKNKRQPMGIVMSPEDSVIGIITIEDILEELVGSLDDRA